MNKNKLNLKGYIGFALIQGDSSLEAGRLSVYCLLNDVKLIRVVKTERCPDSYIPCGSVEWCIQSLGKEITPDYYPEWAKQYLYRKVWKEDKWILGKKLFVKPADRYKRFTGFVTTGTYKKKKKGRLIWSEVVQFTNEWRYYVSAGKILCNGWYWGDEINTPDAPELTIDIPKDYYGALDFGTLKDGTLALVESQHPFACGWYGTQEQDYLYFQWLIDGWSWLRGCDKK
jgi:hypothetical protein